MEVRKMIKFTDKEIIRCMEKGTRELSKEALTPKMIRKAVKILKKNEPKPDEDGMITIEVENSIESGDFFLMLNRNRESKYKIKKGDNVK